MTDLPFNWIDLAVVAIIAVGVTRGRKRGMSEELLDVLKWVVALFACSYLYEPLGAMLSGSTVFSTLSCYVAVYAGILMVVALVFGAIKRRIGAKLVSSDFFGMGEYYLGMVAGGFRYICIILVTLAFLHARYYSPGELQAQEASQQRNFGSTFFPTFGTFQQSVFKGSFVGSHVQTYLGTFLIASTAPDQKGLQKHEAVRARERRVNDLLDRR
jgi:membrane protein required for colicin V production